MPPGYGQHQPHRMPPPNLARVRWCRVRRRRLGRPKAAAPNSALRRLPKDQRNRPRNGRPSIRAGDDDNSPHDTLPLEPAEALSIQLELGRVCRAGSDVECPEADNYRPLQCGRRRYARNARLTQGQTPFAVAATFGTGDPDTALPRRRDRYGTAADSERMRRPRDVVWREERRIRRRRRRW